MCDPLTLGSPLFVIPTDWKEWRNLCGDKKKHRSLDCAQDDKAEVS